MPELPEVETMRRGLFSAIDGKIVSIERPVIPYRPIVIDPSFEQLRMRSMYRKIVAVDRIAKRVLVRLDSGDSIVMQPKMAGLALICDPPSPQHTRLIFHISGAKADRFMYWDRRGLGTVSLWTPDQVAQKIGPEVLGPDPLMIDQSSFISRFSANRREVKVALLDQSLIAGIGNLYAAEILHAARVHPQSRCHELSRKKWQSIYRFAVEILSDAIDHEGSTLSDGTYRNAINGEGQYQNRHRVYDREGLVCKSCGKSKIIRLVQSQRSTFFCPRCQT